MGARRGGPDVRRGERAAIDLFLRIASFRPKQKVGRESVSSVHPRGGRTRKKTTTHWVTTASVRYRQWCRVGLRDLLGGEFFQVELDVAVDPIVQFAVVDGGVQVFEQVEAARGAVAIFHVLPVRVAGEASVAIAAM